MVNHLPFPVYCLITLFGSVPSDADIVTCWLLGYFYHAVTCIQFKPTNDSYFISGCIDGMVRIWDVPKCLVVDWADTKEIITAVSYRPDGKVHTNTLRDDQILPIVFYAPEC